MVPYLVCQFSKRTLSNLVKECFGADFPDVFKKPQVTYLFHYLTDLGAKSVLLEREYLDKDYLEDFSRYYVKCFQNSGHKCARLHFFNVEIDHTGLDNVLMVGKDAPGYGSLQESYLGFIVVKPLPKTFIGKTCLKRYPELTSTDLPDTKCLSKKYRINLFGIDLEVETIAFQEQDKVVSACATTAIWTALHGCSWKNEKQVPACSEITTNAINHIDGSNNSFPNKGLTNKQILRALDCEELKHHSMELRPATSRSEFFDAVRCHIDSGIPLILGAEIHDRNGKLLGGHAVTILGYKKEGDELSFYIHDDRFGPFAKARAVEEDGRCRLTLQRKNDSGAWLDPHEYLDLFSLIIPTDKKVRISYTYPLNTCRLIVEEFENWLAENEEARSEFTGSLTFSLQLFQISEIKKVILSTPCPADNAPDTFMRQRANLLTQSCARFQWVGTFSLKGNQAFRILFDATDIPQGNAITCIFVENNASSAPVLQLFKKYSDSDIIDDQSGSFIHLVYKYLKEPHHSYNRHLDQTYGHLRAPKYLKPAEISDGNICNNDSLRTFYESREDSLDEIFREVSDEAGLIWAIAADGGLLIGLESEDRGHPTLTGFKPARIAGELKRKQADMGSKEGEPALVDSVWSINAKSGRYSGDYTNCAELLENALFKFKSIFPKSSGLLHIEPPQIDQ